MHGTRYINVVVVPQKLCGFFQLLSLSVFIYIYIYVFVDVVIFNSEYSGFSTLRGHTSEIDTFTTKMGSSLFHPNILDRTIIDEKKENIEMDTRVTPRLCVYRCIFYNI